MEVPPALRPTLFSPALWSPKNSPSYARSRRLRERPIDHCHPPRLRMDGAHHPPRLRRAAVVGRHRAVPIIRLGLAIAAGLRSQPEACITTQPKRVCSFDSIDAGQIPGLALRRARRSSVRLAGGRDVPERRLAAPPCRHRHRARASSPAPPGPSYYSRTRSGGVAACASSATASATGRTCCACSPSVRRATVPSCASRLPTTSMYGTLARE